MSKRNMLLGLAAGKVGDLVFYRDGGEQRTRTRVIPKNPRSPMQMAQRVRIANVSALYRLLAPIMRDSFSNRPSNQSGYNAFASGAIELSPFMTKEMANADAVLPMPVVISKGILQGVETEALSEEAGVPSILVPSLTSVESPTLGVVSQAILADYPTLQDGDKITIVTLGFEVDSSSEFDLYHGASFVAELVLDSQSTSPFSSISGLDVEVGKISVAGAARLFDSTAIMATSAVVSRVDGDGSLQTSFSRLVLTEAAQTLYERYRTDAALQTAIESYNAGTESILR